VERADRRGSEVSPVMDLGTWNWDERMKEAWLPCGCGEMRREGLTVGRLLWVLPFAFCDLLFVIYFL
jgi:hypothetical protein